MRFRQKWRGESELTFWHYGQMARVQTRARAVDMLGRQQIAGIQNAVSELFKNAHDAYADKASVDYFEALGANGEDFIVIRDNGIGMTYADFEEKWLVLG